MQNRKYLLLPLLIALVFILSSCGWRGRAPQLEFDTLQKVADRLYGDGYYFFDPGEGYVREHFLIDSSEYIVLIGKNYAKYFVYDLVYADPEDSEKKLIISMFDDKSESEALSIVSISEDENTELVYDGEDKGQIFNVRKLEAKNIIRLHFNDGLRDYLINFTNDNEYATEEERFEAEKTRLIEVFKTRYILPKSK